DVVDDPGRHLAQPAGQPDRAVDRGAGPPAAALVVDPADAGRDGTAVEPGVAEGGGATHQLVVAGTAARLGPLDPGHHRLDPLGLLPAAEAGRDQHDDAVALAVGRDRPPAPLGTAYLHLGLRRVGPGRHVVKVSPDLRLRPVRRAGPIA